MASLGDAKPDSLDVQFGIAERDIDEKGPIAGQFCFFQQRERAVAGECALENEAFTAGEQCPGENDCLPSRGDGNAGWFLWIEIAGDGVGIDDAGLPLEGNGCGESALAGTVWASD